MKKAILCAACVVAMGWLDARSASAQEDGEETPPPPPDAVETPPETAPQPVLTPPPPPQASRETVCDDHQDNDGDSMPDCADADCYEDPHCHAGGGSENTNATCGDWVDNDGDGAVDCDDDDCANNDAVTVCNGSWSGGGGAANLSAPGADEIPDLSGDMSIEDLVGRAGDADGERNDYLCSDGVDNDHDGRTDCQDFGCRFDPSVTVCTASSGIRFSLVTGIAGSIRINETPDIDGDGFTEYSDPAGDVRFTRIQLRALGPIPFIQNSFFLINIRAERTFRLTFATFNVPLGNEGHYMSINSGSGALSAWRVTSTSKMPLLDPPFYLFNAFEQGSGAALEFGGPLTENNMFRYRVFASGGSGEFNGNVGGRFFRADDTNFAYGAGAQLHINFIGHYDRFDTPYMYTPVPLTLALLVGGRFDQRSVERYAWWSAFAVLRVSHFQFRAESNTRYVLDFDGIQTAWNLQGSILLVPRTLMLAFDVGGFFVPLEYDPVAVASVGGFSGSFEQPIEEFSARAAIHWFYFRNIGILTLLYGITLRCQRVFGDGVCRPPDAQPDAAITEHEIRLEAQFRF